MNSKALFILGIIFVSAIIVIFTTKNQTEELEFLQTPTPSVIPINFQTTETSIQNTNESVEGVKTYSKAIVSTSKGEIEIVLFSDAAPKTVQNFAVKANSNFYNNLTFHRVEDWVVQGGDPLGNGTGGGQMETELNNNPFIRGSVGVARGGNINISNDSQFFITKTDAPHLDGLYTNFGQVSNGLEVVDKLNIGDSIISITVE